MVKKTKDKKEELQRMKNSIKGNKYLAEKYPEKKQSIDADNEELEEKIKVLEKQGVGGDGE